MVCYWLIKILMLSTFTSIRGLLKSPSMPNAVHFQSAEHPSAHELPSVVKCMMEQLSGFLAELKMELLCV